MPFRYEVSLTNLTRGQIFSPAVVYSHTKSMRPLFTLGEAASDAVAAVAEDAMLDPLVASLSDNENVNQVGILTGAEGPILPGETASIVIEGSSRAVMLSLIGDTAPRDRPPRPPGGHFRGCFRDCP